MFCYYNCNYYYYYCYYWLLVLLWFRSEWNPFVASPFVWLHIWSSCSWPSCERWSQYSLPPIPTNEAASSPWRCDYYLPFEKMYIIVVYKKRDQVTLEYDCRIVKEEFCFLFVRRWNRFFCYLARIPVYAFMHFCIYVFIMYK